MTSPLVIYILNSLLDLFRMTPIIYVQQCLKQPRSSGLWPAASLFSRQEATLGQDSILGRTDTICTVWFSQLDFPTEHCQGTSCYQLNWTMSHVQSNVRNWESLLSGKLMVTPLSYDTKALYYCGHYSILLNCVWGKQRKNCSNILISKGMCAANKSYVWCICLGF